MSDDFGDIVTFVITSPPVTGPGVLANLAHLLDRFGFRPGFDPDAPLVAVEPGVVYGTHDFPTATAEVDPLTNLAHALAASFPSVAFRLHSDPAQREGQWQHGSLYRHRPGLGLHPAAGGHVACDDGGRPYISIDDVREAVTRGPAALADVLGLAWEEATAPADGSWFHVVYDLDGPQYHVPPAAFGQIAETSIDTPNDHVEGSRQEAATRTTGRVETAPVQPPGPAPLREPPSPGRSR